MKKREKQRLKEMKLREAMMIEMENVYENVVTPRKADQLAIILDELNTKMLISSWKP